MCNQKIVFTASVMFGSQFFIGHAFSTFVTPPPVPLLVAKHNVRSVGLQAKRSRRRQARYDDDDDEFDYYDDDVGEYYEVNQRGRRRDYSIVDDMDRIPSAFSKRKIRSDGIGLPQSLSNAVLAGVFVMGIATGVTIDSEINTDPKDLASRDGIDRLAPNPTLCTSYGASAMAFDQRIFVSFDPFNVYVTQADVKPACVLRPENAVNVLKTNRNLINDKEVRSCKNNISNTWAFVGDLDDEPQVSCVYKSDDAQNEFLSNPKIGIGEFYYVPRLYR